MNMNACFELFECKEENARARECVRACPTFKHGRPASDGVCALQSYGRA